MDWQSSTYWNRELGVFDYEAWFRDGGTNEDLPETLRQNEDNPQREGPGIIPGRTTSGDVGGGTGDFGGPGGAGWFLDWLGAESEKWLKYTSGLKESLEGYATGIDVATESMIAKQAEATEQRALGGMGEAGNLYGGMRPGVVAAIQSGAGQQVAESRSRTKARGEQGLLALSSTYADLLGRGYGAGGGVYGAIYGRNAPYSGMWQSGMPWGTQTGAPIPGQPQEPPEGQPPPEDQGSAPPPPSGYNDWTPEQIRRMKEKKQEDEGPTWY
jgi:hypothetical protein